MTSIHPTTSNITLYIEPPSHHFLEDKLFNVDDGRLNGDRILAPYAYLRSWFATRGIPVHTADYLPSQPGTDKNIYVSMGRLENYQNLTKRPDVILSAFFAMECPIAEPSLYRQLNIAQRYFNRIFSWSDSASLSRFVGGSLRCESFCWPQSFEDVHQEIWSQEHRKFMVMINGNKLPRISWQELYTERLKAVEFFSRTNEIDLYGIGWDEPSFRVGKTWVPWTLRRLQRSLLKQWQKIFPDPLLTAARRVYRGTAKSKAETLGQYTFALCFENSILKGWITEKIFDCFFSGTVPIYWGAPDITSHIPANCFIDMRNFANYQQLKEYLNALTPADIHKYKYNARNYLKSARFQPFTKNAFAQLFAQIIQEDTNIKLI